MLNQGNAYFYSGNDKFESIELFSQTPRICAFEYIYFARPDSIVEGKSVYEVRKNGRSFS